MTSDASKISPIAWRDISGGLTCREEYKRRGSHSFGRYTAWEFIINPGCIPISRARPRQLSAEWTVTRKRQSWNVTDQSDRPQSMCEAASNINLVYQTCSHASGMDRVVLWCST